MFYVKQFDNLLLTTDKGLSQIDDIGSGQAINAYVSTANGWYDMNQSNIAKAMPQRITVQREINATSATTMLSLLDNMRAKLRKRADLVVEYFDGTLRRVTARLDQVSHPVFVGDNFNAAITMQFSTLEDSWRANAQKVDTNSSLNHNDTFLVSNAGNVTVYDMTVTVTVGTNNAPDGFTLTNQTTGTLFGYVNTINTGQVFIFDTGAKTITFPSEPDPYNLVSIATGKNVWLDLQSGNNTFLYEGVDDVDVEFAFYERWG